MPSQVSADAHVPSSTAWARCDVVRAPDVLDRREVGVRREGRHVGALAEAEQAALLEDLQRGRAVGVGGDDVAAEVDAASRWQRLPSADRTSCR